MSKEFVPYELAVKLKKLGFNEPCIMQWHYTNDLLFCVDVRNYPKYKTNLESKSDSLGDCISAPTFSQAFRWFRERYDLVYSIIPESGSGHTLLTRTYNVFIHTFIMNVNVQSEILRVDRKIARYNAYEEAELACLTKLIEIVEQQKQN